MIFLSDRIISTTHTYYSVGQILDILRKPGMECRFTLDVDGTSSGIQLIDSGNIIADFCFDLSMDSKSRYFEELKEFIECELTFDDIQDSYYS